MAAVFPPGTHFKTELKMAVGRDDWKLTSQLPDYVNDTVAVGSTGPVDFWAEPDERVKPPTVKEGWHKYGYGFRISTSLKVDDLVRGDLYGESAEPDENEGGGRTMYLWTLTIVDALEHEVLWQEQIIAQDEATAIAQLDYASAHSMMDDGDLTSWLKSGRAIILKDRSASYQEWVKPVKVVSE